MSRVVIFACNSLIGAITFIPNVMLGDSGTAEAERAALYGTTSSVTFILSGVAGLFNAINTCAGLTSLAVCLQIAAFASFSNRRH